MSTKSKTCNWLFGQWVLPMWHALLLILVLKNQRTKWVQSFSICEEQLGATSVQLGSVCEFSIMFKIWSACVNTFLEPWLKAIHCCSKFFLWNVLQTAVHGQFELSNGPVPDSLDFLLHSLEQPVITGIQVWGIDWVGQGFDGMVVQVVHGWTSRVRGCTVLKKDPGKSVGPQERSFPVQGLPEPLQNVSVQMSVDATPSWYELPVDDPILVKKDHQHGLWNGDLMPDLLRPLLASSEPLHWSSLWFWVPCVKPALVLGDHSSDCRALSGSSHHGQGSPAGHQMLELLWQS